MTIILVITGIFLYLFWPRNEQMKVDVDVKDIGDNNDIKTTETREVSFLHIEGLASAQRTSNWMTFIGFAILFFSIGYAAFHFKFIKGARQIRKDMEKEQMMDRMHEMEEVLIDMGYLKKKRSRKVKKSKKKTTKKTKKKPAKKVTIEDDDDDDDDEDLETTMN